MSLVKKPEMTEKNRAAHRANGPQSRGPVTDGGKANSAASNLRHGFYCRKQNGALAALGEDPQEYADLMHSLQNNLVEGLEGELVQCIGDTLWGMKRAERVRNSLARKRLQAAKEWQKTVTDPQLLQAHENLECYEALGRALARRSYGPTPEEIRTFVQTFSKDPSPELQEFFPLLKSLSKLAEGPERKAARRQARAQLPVLHETYRRSCVRLAEKLDEMQSPENLAALVAPQDEKSLLMQRMEDSNLRRLWRLTNVLFKVRNGALSVRDVKNEDRSGDVYENTGDDDKLSCLEQGLLQENAPNEQ